MMKVKRGRGMPEGTRQKPELYTEILRVLEQDQGDAGDGLTATAISTALGKNRDTVCLYLNDLVKQKKVRCKRLANWKLYRIAAIKKH